MMIDSDAAKKVASALEQATSSRNIEAVMRLYSEDAIVWHNNDNREQSKDENRVTFGSFMELFDKLAYTDIKYTPTKTGFVQQHVVRGLTKDGRELAMPAVLVVTLRDDLIARIDEYLDPAPFYALLGAAE